MDSFTDEYDEPWFHVAVRDSYEVIFIDVPLTFVKGLELEQSLELDVKSQCLVFWSPNSRERPEDFTNKGNTIPIISKLTNKPEAPIAGWYLATILVKGDSKEDLFQKKDSRKICVPASIRKMSPNHTKKCKEGKKKEGPSKKETEDMRSKARKQNLKNALLDLNDATKSNSTRKRNGASEIVIKSSSSSKKKCIKEEEKEKSRDKRKTKDPLHKKDDIKMNSSSLSEDEDRPLSSLKHIEQKSGINPTEGIKDSTYLDKKVMQIDTAGTESSEDDESVVDLSSATSDVSCVVYNELRSKYQIAQKKISDLEMRVINAEDKASEWEDKYKTVTHEQFVKLGAEVLKWKEKFTCASEKCEQLKGKVSELNLKNSELMRKLLDNPKESEKSVSIEAESNSSFRKQASFSDELSVGNESDEECGAKLQSMPHSPKMSVELDDENPKIDSGSDSEKECSSKDLQQPVNSVLDVKTPNRSFEDFDDSNFDGAQKITMKRMSSAVALLPKLGRSWELSPKQLVELVRIYCKRKGAKEDGKFVKAATDLLWTREEQANRSARGVVGRGEAPRPEMTPDKKDYIAGLLDCRMADEGVESTSEREQRKLLIDTYLSSKICTVRRDMRTSQNGTPKEPKKTSLTALKKALFKDSIKK